MHNLKSEVRKAIDSLIQHRCWEGLVLKIKEQELKTKVVQRFPGRGGGLRGGEGHADCPRHGFLTICNCRMEMILIV